MLCRTSRVKLDKRQESRLQYTTLRPILTRQLRACTGSVVSILSSLTMTRRVAVVLLCLLALVTCHAEQAAVVSTASSSQSNSAVIHPSVHRALSLAPSVDIVVRMRLPQSVLDLVNPKAYSDRGSFLKHLRATLKSHHAEALQPLVDLFTSELMNLVVEFRTFWISPVAFIKGASRPIVDLVAAVTGVLEVRQARAYPAPSLMTTMSTTTGNASRIDPNDPVDWGVAYIDAPSLWDKGFTGNGIVVGSIDTGVRSTHEALRDTFIGEYGWFDPELKSTTPHDDNGHGTHTMGSIAGSKGIGVAPDVTWMTCRGCRAKQCLEADLLACMQFMLCPTDPTGANPDCSKAPRIINNSWGGDRGGDLAYKDAIAAWHKAGIIPVFSVGNTGPACGTVTSPGDYPNVIGVGGTTYDYALGVWSSKGPSTVASVKPDITAPGGQIYSSNNKSDTSYIVSSGTSTAAPHVTGTIALLLQNEPTLTYDQIYARLTSTTVQSGLESTNYTCGNTPDTKWPNNQYGWGLVNAYDAFHNKRATPTQPPSSSSGSNSAASSSGTTSPPPTNSPPSTSTSPPTSTPVSTSSSPTSSTPSPSTMTNTPVPTTPSSSASQKPTPPPPYTPQPTPSPAATVGPPPPNEVFLWLVQQLAKLKDFFHWKS